MDDTPPCTPKNHFHHYRHMQTGAFYILVQPCKLLITIVAQCSYVNTCMIRHFRGP
ncbi:hypothetical protein BDZ94DRAFT_1277194 [Collybia nuda]|uniref:Uncharacterized protein n=1 Tax=Collybia nuda TaxID=64659 RepID=A0A9P5XR04_9AGAR|nr:hypothetical protein BDZ94DRAFT_1278389 [Collybia nuda]KAF9455814.1 hypothetical protein BDZ94DRAFT_1277194 [Collybia nuda]